MRKLDVRKKGVLTTGGGRTVTGWAGLSRASLNTALGAGLPTARWSLVTGHWPLATYRRPLGGYLAECGCWVTGTTRYNKTANCLVLIPLARAL